MNNMAVSSSRRHYSWPQLKQIVEFNRKLMFNLNSDAPTSINFGAQPVSPGVNRIYFLANNEQTRDNTLKFVDIKTNTVYDQLKGQQLIFNDGPAYSGETKLTKEEQLLRERQRCSFSGITSYYLDANSSRIVFSDRSELFYFDDLTNKEKLAATDIPASSKGALNFQICPFDTNLVSYVLNDNLYIQNLTTRQEYKLTQSSEPIKSGVPSYAVQEEFNRYVGYWWQPVCKNNRNKENEVTYRIVYEEVDDSPVDLTYITPSVESEHGYDTYRYPKAGTPNSKVQLRLIEFKFINGALAIQRKQMRKSFNDLFNWFEYLVRAEWVPNGDFFYAQIFDRLQTRAVRLLIPVDFFILEDETSSAQLQVIEEQQSNTWINFNNIQHFLSQPNESELEFISATEETGFLHLYHYKIGLTNSAPISPDLVQSALIQKSQLTSGDWCVEYDENVTVDETNRLIYFTAYQDPLESQFFVVDYSTASHKTKQLTYNGYSHQVFINKAANLFVTVCSNLSLPPKAYVFEIANQQAGLDGLEVKQVAQIINRESSSQGNLIDPSSTQFSSLLAINSLLNLNLDSIWQNGQPVNEGILSSVLFGPPQIFSFETEDNCKLYGMLYLPFNYKPGVQYPTVLYVYGGPKAQIVTNAYKSGKFSRFNMLALLGYCVLVIDSRGSDYRGMAFESHLYRRMGTVEISDQVRGIEYAASKFNCIDITRIGIFGWSYGGYMALMGLAQRPDVFKVAISGAPVTTWTLYDTAYTERYMGLPLENQEGYEKGSVLNYAKNFPNEENRLLIIHGMIDENVHFAHTRKLIESLVKESKPYQLQIYPKERHGIRSPEASIHCDVNFFSYLEQNLKHTVSASNE